MGDGDAGVCEFDVGCVDLFRVFLGPLVEEEEQVGENFLGGGEQSGKRVEGIDGSARPEITLSLICTDSGCLRTGYDCGSVMNLFESQIIHLHSLRCLRRLKSAKERQL